MSTAAPVDIKRIPNLLVESHPNGRAGPSARTHRTSGIPDVRRLLWTAYSRVCDLEETQDCQTCDARKKMTEWQPSGFVKLMGIKVTKRSPERSEAELFIREELCNRRGVKHGGAVMGWADTMGGMTASASLANNQRTATIESKTNFFASIPKGDTARAVCTPLHTGRTTIVLQTDITRGDGKLAAMVIQTQIVLPAKQRPE